MNNNGNISKTITKVILIGLANAGKTSIAKFINSLNLNYALNTAPSTNLERLKKKILSSQMIFFVFPGQYRYLKKNMETIFNLLDENTILIYVIDASDKQLKKANLVYIVDLLKGVIKFKRKKQIKAKIPLIFLAHKTDLPDAEDVNSYLTPIKDILTKIKTEFSLGFYNTSIYQPQTLINVIVNSLTPSLIKTNKIQRIATNLLSYTHSKAIVISDYNGFPLAYSGEKNLAFWISTIPIKLYEVLEREIEILYRYNTPIARIFEPVNMQNKRKIFYHELSINKTGIMLLTIKDREILNVAIVNPQINREIIKGILLKIAEKIMEILTARGDIRWN